MNTLQKLNSLSKEEFFSFVNSFDYVLSDVDGVLLLASNVIPGSDQCIENFRKLGKTVAFVTNNSFTTTEVIKNHLKPFEAVEEEIVTPSKAIVTYLKNVKYDKSKKLFVIGSTVLKRALCDNGFEIAHFEPERLLENDTFDQLYKDSVKVQSEAHTIGGVLSFIESNCSYLSINRACNILAANSDILFLTSGGDDFIPIGSNLKILAAKCYTEAMKGISNKQNTILAKPGVEFGKIVNNIFGITDPKRVLFIGDSITSDMQFATNCGYQKLLVLSGTTKESSITNWTHSEDVKPQYYVKSLNDINLLFWKYNVIENTK